MQTFEFTSGITVGVGRVSPLLYSQIEAGVRQAKPKPAPPKNHVTYPDGREGDEENPSDPDYQDAVELWEREIDREASRLYDNAVICLAVEVEIDQAQLSALRELMAISGTPLQPECNALGAPYPEPQQSKIQYVRYCCVAAFDDLRRLSEVLYRRSVPTEEQVQQHLATFPAAVQKAAA